MNSAFFLIFVVIVVVSVADYISGLAHNDHADERMNLLADALDSKAKATWQVTEKPGIHAATPQAEPEETLKPNAETSATAAKPKATVKAAVHPEPVERVVVTHTVCQDATTLLQSPVTHWVDMEQRTAKRFGAWITTEDGSVFRAFRDAAGNVIVPDYVKAVVEPAELTATSEAVYVEKTMEPWEIEEELIKQCASSPQADLFAPSGIFPNNTVH